MRWWVDSSADLEPIARMAALQRLFFVGTGTPDLRLLDNAPRLRMVYVDDWD
jgi:hypothetical protein